MNLSMTNWIFALMGIFLIIVGIVIWAGRKLDLVHGDEASKVNPEDVKPYAKLLGIGVILMGVGVALYGGLGIFEVIPTFVPYVSLGAFAVAGVLVCYLGQKKYFKGES